jgi:hypothetical protein
MWYRICFAIVFVKCLHLYIARVLTSSLFFCCGLIWFLYQCNAGLIECVLKNSYLFYFRNYLGSIGINYSLNIALIQREAIWIWMFLWRLFIINSISLLFIVLFRFSTSSWFNLIRCICQKYAHFSKLINLFVYSCS